MESFRLKNIIILILVLVNACLLVSLSSRKAAELSGQRTATEQLVELFDSRSVALDPDIIPDQSPPLSRVLTRSTDQDRALAVFLLGADLTRADQGGGIYSYDSSQGAALFRSNGSFDAAGALASGDGAAACLEFCDAFDYTEPVFSLDENGSGTATATQLYNGYPVINSTVTFDLDNGALMTASGLHLPDAYTETLSPEAPLSALAALTAFLDARRDDGSVVSAVTNVYPCYELQSTTAVPMSLVPAWCIETDISTLNYYVNCITGAVTHS